MGAAPGVPHHMPHQAPPSPPPGPGVIPPFVGPPVEKRFGPLVISLAVGGVLLLICTIGGILGGYWLSDALQEEANGRSRAVVTDYLQAWRDEDYETAYNLLCEQRRRLLTREEFETDLTSQGDLVAFRIYDVEVRRTRYAVPVDLEFADGSTEMEVFYPVAEATENGVDWRVC